MHDITFEQNITLDSQVFAIQNKPSQGAYMSSLEKIYSQLRMLQSHHCKVFVCRIDLHINEKKWDEGDLTYMLKTAKRKLRKHYKTRHIGHAWAREKCKNGRTHFHLSLFLDGNKVRSAKPINDIISKKWKEMGHPATHYSNSHMLLRDDLHAFSKAYYHLSYLCKVYTKDGQPPRRRNFGASTVKRKISTLFTESLKK